MGNPTDEGGISQQPIENRLALGELLTATGLAKTDLLTFDFASVTGHEARGGQRGAQRRLGPFHHRRAR